MTVSSHQLVVPTDSPYSLSYQNDIPKNASSKVEIYTKQVLYTFADPELQRSIYNPRYIRKTTVSFTQVA